MRVLIKGYSNGEYVEEEIGIKDWETFFSKYGYEKICGREDENA